MDEDAFTLDQAEQGGVQVLPSPFVPDGVPVPQNFVAAPSGIQVAANSFAAGIGAAWDLPPSLALSPLLKYSITGEQNWQIVPVSNGANNATISGLIDGQEYDVSLSFVTPSDVVGASVVESNVVANAVVDPPLPPTNLQVSAIGGGVAFIALTASASAGIWKTLIFRDGTQIAEIHSDPDEEITYSDDVGMGTFSWSARSLNVSNKPSASDAGPVTATII